MFGLILTACRLNSSRVRYVVLLMSPVQTIVDNANKYGAGAPFSQ